MVLANTLVSIFSIVSLVTHAYALSRPQSSSKATRRCFLLDNSGLALASLAVGAAISPEKASAVEVEQPVVSTRRIQPMPKQYIAVLLDKKNTADATHGVAADQWGLWTVDPGPRGVLLQDSRAKRELAETQRGPYGWSYNPNDWWLEEHGILMERPKFPMVPGTYQVTGDQRDITAILTIKDNGNWSLDGGAKLQDVVHLPCRSARYTSPGPVSSCTPNLVNPFQFPVRPGAIMPSVVGCQKQDYAVLFVTGKVFDS